MRTHLSIAAALITACFASAQAPNEKFEIFPDQAGAALSATTRMSLSTSAGEILQEVPGSFFAGVGDTGAGCKITGFTVATQDQNQATQETYNIIVRSNLPAGGPDASAAGLILRSADQLLPTNPVGGAAAFIVTFTFATPVTVPCTGGISYGLEVRAGAWTADAQSMHMAFYSPTPAGFPAGDNTRLINLTNAANQHAWYILGGSAFRAAANGASVGRTMRCAVFTNTANLNLGNKDPLTTKTPDFISYGAGGMYPAIKDVANSRDDGLEARVLDTPNAGGKAYVFMSISPFGPGLPLPGWAGNLYLNFGGPITFMGSAAIVATGSPVQGIALISMLPPGSVPASVIGGKLCFQAVSHNASFGNLRISNAQAQSY